MGRLQDIGRATGASIALALLVAASGVVANTASVESPAAAAPAAVAQARPAVGVRLGGDAARTRVVLDLGAETPGRVRLSQAGGRLALDVPVAGVPESAGRGHGLVAGWALEPSATGVLVSLDVAPGAMVQKRFLIPPSADTPHWRYVVDLAVADPLAALIGDAPAATAAAAATSVPRTPAPAPRERAALVVAVEAPPRASPAIVARAPAVTPRTSAILTGRQKVIVIDAGHGGHDTGARSLVRNEKDINLAAALALRDRLQRTGRYRVVLTRSDDTFIPLEGRVRIARTAKADLFISLHSDSAGQDPTPHGASVYTVSDHGVTRVGEVLGQHEWFSVAGDRRTDPGVGKILLDLTQRSTRNRSAEFATRLVDRLGQSVDMLPHGRRDASYFVLLAPDVPAVLLEMGFITNPGDELRLTDPEQRRAMMDRVADAIDDYFAPGRVIAER